MSGYFERFFVPSKQSYFLFGPRGTGKSTWLRHKYPHALYINLLKMDELRSLRAYPERLIERVEASGASVVIIDEIQKVPELLSVVHDLIETRRELQFILTGSSARKLKRTGVDLLAGRAVIRQFHPFIAAELGENFSLTNAMSQGLVPLIFNSPDKKDSLNAYVGLYLEEEVKAEGWVRNIGDFARFLEVMAFSQGAVVNFSNISRECQVTRKVIMGYVDVIQDLLIACFLPVFSLRAKRELVLHDKFYFFDVGVYHSLRQTTFLDKESEVNGAGLEGLVLQHLRAWNDYQGSLYKIYYWRTRYGVEVDFILHSSDKLYAIEVKNAKIIHPKDLSGLKSFCEDYPEATPILLYRGNEKLKKGNVLCLPVDLFLLHLDPKLPTLYS